jgi:tripartite-type tricarboxylate transporter receptor subunit TctC
MKTTRTLQTSTTAQAAKLQTQKRRTLVVALASLLFIGTGIFLSQQAHAQNYPTKPVKIVVPFATGGPADNYARFMAQRLQESLGQTFVVDNKPGAGSVIGTDLAAKAAPDGYTLLLMSNTQTVNETLIPNKPYGLMKDFVGVAPINYSDLVLVVNPKQRFKLFGRCHSRGQSPTRQIELCLFWPWYAVPHGRRIVQKFGQN